MFSARLTLSDHRWITDEPLLEITHIKQVRRRKNTASLSNRRNLKTFESLIPKVKYGLLRVFFFPTSTKCHVVCVSSLTRIQRAAFLFPPFAPARRRLKACVIVYQEPVTGANAIFVMLYWSQRREFVFQSCPVHGAVVERRVLSSKMPEQDKKG